MVFNFLFPKTSKPSTSISTSTSTPSPSTIETSPPTTIETQSTISPQSPAVEIEITTKPKPTQTSTTINASTSQEDDSKMSTSRSSSSLESGYVSGTSSSSSASTTSSSLSSSSEQQQQQQQEQEHPRITLTPSHLQFINSTLNALPPLEILRWCKLTFPHLFQITAFGLSGLVTLDMLSQLASEELTSAESPQIDAIFFDTLHHFRETLNLIERTRARYPNVRLHIYRPAGATTPEEFTARHGPELWKRNEQLYDWVAKVEPARRAYAELGVSAVLTGRRRSQGAKRSSLEIVEVDDAGLIKINPLAGWSFAQVQAYVREHDVPYNALLDRGYKSVGDWHSTEPVGEGEDERSGRWKGQGKTECGIHNRPSKYAQFLKAAEEEKKRLESLGGGERLGSVNVGQPIAV